MTTRHQTMKTETGWHFCAIKNGEPVLRDETPAKRAGETETYDGEIVMCVSGLHYSPCIVDALSYARGLYLRYVEGGTEIEDSDKIVTRTRKIIAEIDATRLLREFACDCAKRMLLREREAGRETDERGKPFVSLVQHADELRAARAAASAAAVWAVWAAAEAAGTAGDAERLADAAARSALAARVAKTNNPSAAKTAAWESWEAESDWQTQRLEHLAKTAMGIE